MYRILGLAVAIMFGSTVVLAAADDVSASDLSANGEAKILLAQAPPPPPPPPSGGHSKPKPPPVMKPKPSPDGAHQATKGQHGKCICSTNAQGTTMCTGGC